MSRRKTEVGIREIARESGVSPATVSRVLRGFPHVSEAVRLQVLTAAGRLHYHPESSEERGGFTRSVIRPAVLSATQPLMPGIASLLKAIRSTPA